MVADTVRLTDDGIAGVRIRIGRFGKPVIQVQRHIRRWRVIGPPPDGAVTEPWGLSQWCDAGRSDAIELAKLIEGLRDTD